MYVMFEYFNRNKDQHCNVNTRNTGSDNVATRLADRQSEVSRGVRSSPFQHLRAA